MTPAAINKIKKKYNLDDADLTSVMTFIVCDNRIFAWQRGAGLKSTAKSTSHAVIAGRYFNSPNVVSAVDELKDKIGLSTINVVDRQNKKLSINDNNYKEQQENPDSVLKAGMSKAETINVLNNLAKRVKDPKQLADITLKITNLMEFETKTDSTNTPVIYLPQRCDTCPHKPKE